MLLRKFILFIGSLAMLALAGCGTPNQGYPAPPVQASSNNAATLTSGYGVVQAIDMVPRQTQSSGGMGLGTVAGAVVGGVLGNQIGQGRGQTAATVVGAAGGALAGHAIENRGQQTAQAQVYRVSLRMDDGSVQTLVQEAAPNLRIGDRVRISNGVIERM